MDGRSGKRHCNQQSQNQPHMMALTLSLSVFPPALRHPFSLSRVCESGSVYCLVERIFSTTEWAFQGVEKISGLRILRLASSMKLFRDTMG
mmetsp:Transcript_21736/g.44685  ORF Transcript_21736/g.44685 Transcript_21736/m.44685 type:complete len:91 (-) Transcript_21736:16-288(-)